MGPGAEASSAPVPGRVGVGVPAAAISGVVDVADAYFAARDTCR